MTTFTALIAAMAVALLVLVAPGSAVAAPTCPNSNPIVQENYCQSGATSAYQLDDPTENVGGFPTKTSFDKGESIPLKIGRNQPTFPTNRVDVQVYRTGYYDGLGSRLIPGAGANGVTVNNSFQCNPMNATTGELDCGNWNVTYTIPGSSLPGTGVYVAKIRTTDTGEDNWIFFVVRDDDRAVEAQALVVIPTATYQAYNTWGGKSLYFDKNGGADTVTGTKRAAKVSFNRPLDDPTRARDGYFGPDYSMVQFLEEQGYDVAYTDDVAAHQDPTELRQHRAVIIPGHSEYWSLEQFNGVKAARDAGVDIASFSANTAYWKVRLRERRATAGLLQDRPGRRLGLQRPRKRQRLGTRRPRGHRRRRARRGRPRRHPGRPAGELHHHLPRQRGAPRRPERARAWSRRSRHAGEPALRRHVLRRQRQPQLPAAGTGRERQRRVRGRPRLATAGLSLNAATQIGEGIVGWEWDSVPTQAQYLSRQPAGVKRISSTDTTSDDPSWLQDEGRQRASVPPAGMDGTVNAVKYTAPSGALVFAGGSNQWSWGLTYEADDRIRQATYNVLADMNVQPLVPTGVSVDPAGSNPPPTAAFTATPDNPKLNVTVQFNASASSDPDGTITNYYWDLDGDGSYETNTGTNPNTSRSYSTEGPRDVRLRVTDNGGATDFTVRTVNVIGNLAPTAAFTATPNPVVVGQTASFNGTASSDPDGTITNYSWDLDGNGTFETNTGTTKTASTTYATTGLRNVQLRVTDNGGKTATATIPLTVNNGGVSQLRRHGAGHARSHQLLAHGRAQRPDVRGLQGHRARDGNWQRHLWRHRRPGVRPQPSGELRRRDRLRPGAGEPLEHAQADGRVLAQLGPQRR